MLDIAVALPVVDEGCAPAEEKRITILEESGDETSEFGARWHGIDREGQNPVREKKISDGGRVGRECQRGRMLFLGLGMGNTMTVSTSGYHR
jgi:hypothetical protein